jgi:hypothetical protein
MKTTSANVQHIVTPITSAQLTQKRESLHKREERDNKWGVIDALLKTERDAYAAEKSVREQKWDDLLLNLNKKPYSSTNQQAITVMRMREMEEFEVHRNKHYKTVAKLNDEQDAL